MEKTILAVAINISGYSTTNPKFEENVSYYVDLAVKLLDSGAKSGFTKTQIQKTVAAYPELAELSLAELLTYDIQK